jgi:hypothetical protein
MFQWEAERSNKYGTVFVHVMQEAFFFFSLYKALNFRLNFLHNVCSFEGLHLSVPRPLFPLEVTVPCLHYVNQERPMCPCRHVMVTLHV